MSISPMFTLIPTCTATVATSILIVLLAIWDAYIHYELFDVIGGCRMKHFSVGVFLYTVWHRRRHCCQAPP